MGPFRARIAGENRLGYELAYCRLDNEWPEIFEEVCRQANMCCEAFHESPFWEVENTITGMIASAAMAKKHPALCETFVLRGKNKPQTTRLKPNKQSQGRIDLYMKLGCVYYWCEAKNTGPLAGQNTPRDSQANTITTALMKAEKDAREAREHAEEFDGTLMAMSYTRLYLARSHYPKGGRPKRREYARCWAEYLEKHHTNSVLIADCSKMEHLENERGYRPFGLVIATKTVT